MTFSGAMRANRSHMPASSASMPAGSHSVSQGGAAWLRPNTRQSIASSSYSPAPRSVQSSLAPSQVTVYTVSQAAPGVPVSSRLTSSPQTGFDTAASRAPSCAALAALLYCQNMWPNSTRPNVSSRNSSATMVNSMVVVPDWSRPRWRRRASIDLLQDDALLVRGINRDCIKSECGEEPHIGVVEGRGHLDYFDLRRPAIGPGRIVHIGDRETDIARFPAVDARIAGAVDRSGGGEVCRIALVGGVGGIDTRQIERGVAQSLDDHLILEEEAPELGDAEDEAQQERRHDGELDQGRTLLIPKHAGGAAMCTMPDHR